MASFSRSMPLIQARLYRPPVPRLFLRRLRLNELLTRGLAGPLSLVCAPAGFGKTTAVSAWIEELNAGDGEGASLPSAWLSIDDREGNLTVFMRYFIAALRTIFPGACAQTEELLAAPLQPRLALLVATLSNEIAALPSRVILVLDDNSVADSRVVYDLLNALLRDWPPPLHLVLIGRREPPLPLAGLRAKGMLTEIRTGDLRFTRQEIGAYLDLCLPAHADASLVGLLDQATEGWITGLHLIARTSHSPDLSDVEKIIGAGSVTDIADYLFDEVLAVQPEPVRLFLLQTAIFDRYDASLAAAVLESEDPECNVQACMEWVERADLFVTAQDDRREWYRCHPLFRDLLLKRLREHFSPEQVNRLHERAASWFAGRGLTDEGIHHALAAANLDLAARLIEQGLCDVLNRDDTPTLRRWMGLLPDELIQRRPGLLLCKAWVLQSSWQLAAQARVLDQMEALLAADAGRDPSEIAYDVGIAHGQLVSLRAQLLFWNNQPTQAIAYCQEGLALLPSAWAYVRGSAMVYESVSMWTRGDGESVAQRLLERYELLEQKTDQFALRHLLALCFIWELSGQLERLRQTAQVMLEQVQRSTSQYIRNWAYYFLGLVYYERYELDKSETYLSVLVEHPYVAFMPLLHDSFALMALAYQARGEIAGAMHLSRRLSELDVERLGDESDVSRSLRARLQLLQGDLEEAGRWADTFTAPLFERPLLWIENPYMTRARILIARNRGADAATALELLEALHDLAGRTHNTRVKIEVLALQALALDALGRPEDALSALRQAVDLCRPGDFIWVFADLGPHMQAMLRRLARQGFAVETIRQILAAFPRGDADAAVSGRGTGGVHSADLSALSSVEGLTPRELEILERLRKNHSDKEIARELFLSPATVQRHKANIYGKLGVHRRADAVAEAEMLGILPPP